MLEKPVGVQKLHLGADNRIDRIGPGPRGGGIVDQFQGAAHDLLALVDLLFHQGDALGPSVKEITELLHLLARLPVRKPGQNLGQHRLCLFKHHAEQLALHGKGLHHAVHVMNQPLEKPSHHRVVALAQIGILPLLLTPFHTLLSLHSSRT